MTAQTSKRMAVLVRREGDTREFFSSHWQNVHGPLVAQLPRLNRYIQNHIIEDFLRGPAAFRADGFVEQQWESAQAMQQAYETPIAKNLLQDEPNYLGHATNYVTLADAPLKAEPDGKKLILVFRHGGEETALDRLERKANALDGCIAQIRDTVTMTIPKAGMSKGPQMVDAFLHLYFDTLENTREAGSFLAEEKTTLPPVARLGVYRVRTVQII